MSEIRIKVVPVCVCVYVRVYGRLEMGMLGKTLETLEKNLFSKRVIFHLEKLENMKVHL